MIERRPPFGPEDLPATEPAADLATSLAMGRELESAATEAFTVPGEDFTTRVMSAIALEPVSQPSWVAGGALRAGRPLALIGALGDAWRVAFSGGRPTAVRAQALALVLVAALAAGSLLSVGGLAVAGALGLFDGQAPVVQPSPSPAPTPAPSPAPAVSASPTPPPTPTPATTPSVMPTDTAEPEQTDGVEETQEPRGTDDSGGNSGPGGGG